MFANKTLWIFLLAAWMAGSTWWHFCKIKQLCADDGPITGLGTAPAVVRQPLTIADGDRFRLELPGNFSFAKSGANANLNALHGSMASLVAYQKANPGRALEITGYYAEAEANTSSFANLGLARAEGIKQYLIQQGIPAKSLTTKGVLQESLAFTPEGDSLYGGVGFAFSGENAPAPAGETTETELTTTTPPELVTVAAGVTEDELAAAEKFSSVFEPIDLYFPLGEASYIKTPETKKFFDEAAKYLTTHKDKKLLMTGHTDNSGPEAVNRRLSRDRAKQVKGKLLQWKIDEEQLVVDSKGEAEPKASNDTREGRKANRRVTVVVQ